MQDRADDERLTQTYLEQVNVNLPFRDLVTFFASIRYLHIVPQLVREPDRSVGRSNDPFGGDFLEQVARTQERTRNARMRRIRKALQVAVPQLEEVELTRDARGVPHLRARYQHWRPHGAWHTEEQLSDGTLRLMGLLWATMDGRGPLLLEEPELSLHPFPRARSGRQEGPAYTSRMTEFASEKWRPGVAAKHSESLRRALRCLQRLAAATTGY